MSTQHTGDLREPSAADALSWMREQVSDTSPVLFRGQRELYPTIFPSLLRQDIAEEDRQKWWRVLRRFVSSRTGIAGYEIRSAHDAVSIVQHYLVKSPVIDLTGTPEVALYFAIKNASREKLQVVYRARVGILQEAGFVVSDHDFLTLPLQEGGLKHRWLRQNGFTVGLPDWTNLDGARTLDFACLPGVEKFLFRAQPHEKALVAALGDLETVEGDPLAASVRGMFESVARSLGCHAKGREMMPCSGTVDAHACLIRELQSLAQRSRALRLPSSDVSEIERLLQDAEYGIWDMGHSASLEYWTDKVNTAASVPEPF